MKTHIVAAAALLVGCCFSVTGQQSHERLVTRLPVERNEPLVILETKVNGRDITPGEKFTANDEWIRSIAFVVKNTSNKRVLFASVDLFFSQPDGANVMFNLFYGPFALQSRPPKPEELLVGISPGDTTEIAFSERQFAGFTKFVEETKLGRSIPKLDMRIGSVILEDDTMWSRGEFSRRDPSNPRGWINVSP
jgi:hypothetical protein